MSRSEMFMWRRSASLEAALGIELHVAQVQAVELDLFLEALVEVVDDALEHAQVGGARGEATSCVARSYAVVSRERALDDLDGPCRIAGETSATAPKSRKTMREALCG